MRLPGFDSVARELPAIEKKMPEGTRLQFLPAADDASVLTLYVQTTSGTPLERAEQRLAEVEKFLETAIPADERTAILTEIGVNPDGWAAHTRNSGPQDATIRVLLSPKRKKSSSEYLRELRPAFEQNGRFPVLRIVFDRANRARPAINVQIEGGSPVDGARVAQEVCDLATKVTSTADVHVVQRSDSPYLILQIDRVKAADLGLTVSDVLRQVQTAGLNAGNPICVWIGANNSHEIAVESGLRLDDILSAPLAGMDSLAPRATLRDVIQTEPRYGPMEVNHSNFVRVFNVWVNTDNRASRDVAADIETKLKDLKLPRTTQVRVVVE